LNSQSTSPLQATPTERFFYEFKNIFFSNISFGGSEFFFTNFKYAGYEFSIYGRGITLLVPTGGVYPLLAERIPRRSRLSWPQCLCVFGVSRNPSSTIGIIQYRYSAWNVT